MDPQFLELEPHIGIEPSHYHYHDPKTGEIVEHPNAGEPGPLRAEGCSYAVPTLVNGEIIPQTRHVHIEPSSTPVSDGAHTPIDAQVAADARIIPGTRQIETTNPLLVDVLCQAGYVRIDPPKSLHTTRGKNASGEKED